MNFNTLRERAFLRLPRSYRVAEKSDPICSREPNYVCCFSSKSDRCTGTAQRSDGLRRYKLASRKFNTFARWGFSPFAEILSRCGEIRSDRLPRAKLCCFSAKSDQYDSRTQRFDVRSRYKRASIKFNTSSGGCFLRLPRSYRVAEKSDPICSREPNCAVFQQITTVVQAQLYAPMDPSAMSSQA